MKILTLILFIMSLVSISTTKAQNLYNIECNIKMFDLATSSEKFASSIDFNFALSKTSQGVDYKNSYFELKSTPPKDKFWLTQTEEDSTNFGSVTVHAVTLSGQNADLMLSISLFGVDQNYFLESGWEKIETTYPLKVPNFFLEEFGRNSEEISYKLTCHEVL